MVMEIKMSKMPGQPHTHGMHTLPKTREVVDGLRESVSAGDVRKAGTWIKCLPSDMTSGKASPEEVRALRRLLRQVIESRDPAMIKVLFAENRRLATILNAEARARVRWEFPLDTLMFNAIETGEPKVVQAIMERLDDLEPEAVFGLFCDAASAADTQLVARLLERVDVAQGMNPLRAMAAAISGGSIEVVTMLRARGVDFDATKEPAAFCITERTFPVIAELQRMGLNLDAKHSDPRMGTALRSALFLNEYPKVHALLAHGANPNIEFEGGPVLEVVMSRTVGKDLEEAERKAAAAIIDAGGRMPNIVHEQSAGGGLNGMLIAAAFFGAERFLTEHASKVAEVSCGDHPALVSRLLPAGQLPGGPSLMSMAAAADSARSVRVLHRLGLSADGDGRGEPPLVTAVRRNKPQAVRALIECGANHRLMFEGGPLLKWVEKNASEEIVRTLRAAEMSGKLMDVMSEQEPATDPSAGAMPL